MKTVVEGNLGINSDVGIILPTYCEAANIEKLIEEIETLQSNVCILVIDDSSLDGTSGIVQKIQKKYRNILLFIRPKKTFKTKINYAKNVSKYSFFTNFLRQT